MGLTFPNALGLAAGLRQERRRHRRARARSASATSRSAPSPASRSRATRGRGCSGCRRTGPWSTGWASTTTAPRPSPPRLAAPRSPPSGRCSASTSARPRWCRRTEARARLRDSGGCSRRTPTTSWSTSARRTRPGCATCRPWRSSADLLARCARGRRPTVPLLVKIAPDLADDDVLAVADLARDRPRRDHRDQHHDLPRGPGSTPAQVAAAGAGGLSGRPLTERSLRGAAAAARPGRRRRSR